MQESGRDPQRLAPLGPLCTRASFCRPATPDLRLCDQLSLNVWPTKVRNCDKSVFA